MLTAQVLQMSVRRGSGWRALTLALVVLAGAATPLRAQTDDGLPAVFKGVGVTERLGDVVPDGIVFRNQDGLEVTTQELLHSGQPVILNFVYYSCPMLCSILLDQLVDGLKDVSWNPGAEFQIVTVSMAPFEGPELAQKHKERYLALLGRPGTERGWHFLTGSEEAVSELAQAVGFGYRWVEDTNDYAHPAALIFLSGDGRITRYLHGMDYPAGKLEKALIEAGEGSVASIIDRIVLYCYRYDPASNEYVVHAENLMKAGGALTILALGGLLLLMWRREVGRRSGLVRPPEASIRHAH